MNALEVRAELVERWRVRADAYDALARHLRDEGAVEYAERVERDAADLRLAADAIEAELETRLGD